jgi:signal transduction histidine kinase
MMMQAGAAEVLLRTDPDAGRAAIAIIRQSAASALTELDEMIPLLGDLPSPGTGDHGLDDLHAMVDRLRAGGLGVSVGLTGDLASLTGTAAATTYRIVQEALTNVLRHAGGAEAFVRIEVQDGGVSVEVRDDGPGMCPGAGPGHGLVGLAERARLAGGTFETGPVSPAGGFRVVAWLPLGARVVMP